jgi:hypothetical protein
VIQGAGIFDSHLPQHEPSIGPALPTSQPESRSFLRSDPIYTVLRATV